MYKKILVGTDGSKESEKAIKKSIELVKKYNSEIILYHSVKHRMPPPRIPILLPFSLNEQQSYQIPEPDYLEIQKSYEESGKKVLKEGMELYDKEGIKITSKLVLDIDPADYAQKMVKKEGVDLVIIGCKGHHSGLSRVFLGSVAEKVLNKVETDILIVR